MVVRLICFCLFSTTLSAQWTATAPRWEGGMALGLGHYAGDLAERAFSRFGARPAFETLLRYRCLDRWWLRWQWSAGNIRGADAQARDEALQARSLSFEGHLNLLSLTAQWDILHDRLTPYGYAGIAFAWMFPEVRYTGQALDFKRRVPFGLPERTRPGSSLAWPFGAGLRYHLPGGPVLQVEAGWWFVQSDYLDGVSQNGNPGRADWYYSARLGLLFPLGHDAP